MARVIVKLGRLANGADAILGHSLIDFDLSHLHAVHPGLRLLRVPAVDTFRLNLLAFPHNPSADASSILSWRRDVPYRSLESR